MNLTRIPYIPSPEVPERGRFERLLEHLTIGAIILSLACLAALQVGSYYGRQQAQQEQEFSMELEP